MLSQIENRYDGLLPHSLRTYGLRAFSFSCCVLRVNATATAPASSAMTP